MRRSAQFSAVFGWMLILFLWSRSSFAAAEMSSDELHHRAEYWAQIKEISLASFISTPAIRLDPVWMDIKDIPKDLQSGKEYESISKIWQKFIDKADPEKGYVDLANYLKKIKKSPLYEWGIFLQADLLYQVQNKKTQKFYNLPLEEYKDAIQSYPLNTQIPRVLYQIGLLELELTFYSDVENTLNRAYKEYPGSEYEPRYHLLMGEQLFRALDDIRANSEFTYVLEHFPKSEAAADAAFRRAFIQFRKNDFVGALRSYETLDQYHSDAVEILKMKKDPDAADKFLDRIYYAETLFQTGKDGESAAIFEYLANLHPKAPTAPLLYVRLADTYFRRNQTRAAESLYEFVLDKYRDQSLAEAMGKIHLADLRFLSGEKEERIARLYSEASDAALKVDNKDVASIALTKLSAYELYFENYPKAQSLLLQLKSTYPDATNANFVDKEYTRTVEIEIFDYYNREDYMAALATFLVYDHKPKAQGFSNTRMLMSLSDAAKKLGLYEKASEILNRVIYLEKTSEGRQEALLKLVDLLIIQGDLRKAAERLRRFNFAYPTTASRYLYEMYWGKLYSTLKNSEQAVDHYEKAVEAASASPRHEFEIRTTYLRLGENYEKLKLPVKAAAAYSHFAKIIEDASASPLAMSDVSSQDKFELRVAKFKVADIDFTLQDYVRALDGYRQIAKEFKEEPFQTHARFRQGECYLGLGDRGNAVKVFKTIDSADNTNLWVQAAKSYIQTVQMEAKYGIRILN